MAKTLTTLLSACLIATCIGSAAHAAEQPITLASLENSAVSSLDDSERILFSPFQGTSIAGNYLSGRFAQGHHDWGNANKYMSRVLAIDPHDQSLVKRTMILAMGSGHAEKAVSMAADVLKNDPKSALALLFLATDAFKKKNYESASSHIYKVPDSGLSEFIMPLMESWVDAAQGKQNTDKLNTTSIHIYHAILIANYLGKPEKIEELLKQSLKVEQISPKNLNRIADIYAHIGKTDKALELYQKVVLALPDNPKVLSKINALKAGEDLEIFNQVNTPEEGVAEALYDTAHSLYQEYGDESARIFAHMALYLNPNYTNAKLLLAHIASRHERYGEAIGYYKSIAPDNEHYASARRRAADLLEDSERIDEALLELQNLVDNYNDLEALIQIGDVYRRSENFKKALEYYNKSAKTLGKDIPADYWHLYYVRGMSYERLGKWQKAEADLKTALTFQPNHPFILNYLGYAWADQGTNLKESLEMIRKAAALRPTDGYITDSLGWVLYRMGEYQYAVPHLEKAVELLPYDPVINDHLGDAYWRVGRKLEARFQWNRAKNHAEEDKIVAEIDIKLSKGLTDPPVIRASNTAVPDENTAISR